MPPTHRIEFQAVSARATDFLHELNDPSLLQNRAIPARASVELRKQQIVKLQENITVLSAKREEFNRKIEEYVENLKALIRATEKGLNADRESLAAAAAEATRTLVRCLACDAENVFEDLQILFARESEESLGQPTELYVIDGGTLKKGHFRCDACGAENILIRSC